MNHIVSEIANALRALGISGQCALIRIGATGLW